MKIRIIRCQLVPEYMKIGHFPANTVLCLDLTRRLAVRRLGKSAEYFDTVVGQLKEEDTKRNVINWTSFPKGVSQSKFRYEWVRVGDFQATQGLPGSKRGVAEREFTWDFIYSRRIDLLI